MKWKDSNDTVELDDITGDDPQSGKSFSIKEDNGMNPSAQNSLLQGKKMPIILVGGGVLILVVLLIWLISGSGSNTSVQQFILLESRIKALDVRISELEPLAGAAKVAAEQVKSIPELTKRIDGLQAVFTKEIDSLSRRLAALAPQKAAEPPVKTPPPETKAATAPVRKATHHVVQAGDTLYRISRRYNLKLEELQRLNNLKPGAAIHPGQKLLVSPPKP